MRMYAIIMKTNYMLQGDESMSKQIAYHGSFCKVDSAKIMKGKLYDINIKRG